MALCNVCNVCPEDGYYLIRTVTDEKGNLHYQVYQFPERPDDKYLTAALDQMDRLPYND